jgi:hypothetical protein
MNKLAVKQVAEFLLRHGQATYVDFVGIAGEW